MVFTGAEWVSPCYDRSNQSSSSEYQVSKVMGLMTLLLYISPNYLCRSISSRRSSELREMVRDLLIPKVSHVLSNVPKSDAMCPGNDALLN